MCLDAESTTVNRHGGFADHVRCHWGWAIPLPASIDAVKSGALFCGGITVFNPIIQCNVLPTERVGGIGIGGLGHMALQFLNKWGCEITAFTSSDAKHEEAMCLGAHHVVTSHDSNQLSKIAGSLDFIVCAATASLPWDAILNSLARQSRLHIVGVVQEPIPVAAFSLIGGQKSVSGSPVGSPYHQSKMIEFAARHAIATVVEEYPMSTVNDAVEHLRSGQGKVSGGFAE